MLQLMPEKPGLQEQVVLAVGAINSPLLENNGLEYGQLHVPLPSLHTIHTG